MTLWLADATPFSHLRGRISILPLMLLMFCEEDFLPGLDKAGRVWTRPHVMEKNFDQSITVAFKESHSQPNHTSISSG